MNTTVKIGTEVDFFRRGRELAKRADARQKLVAKRVITFEDPAALLKLFTPARVALFGVVKEHPGSISDISARLDRDRSAVKRDIDEMAKAGLFTIEVKVHPGHGQKKEIRAVANQINLCAVVR